VVEVVDEDEEDVGDDDEDDCEVEEVEVDVIELDVVDELGKPVNGEKTLPTSPKYVVYID
jgi:hypothetical protein